MEELVVGCPVAHRAWILDAWFDHIEETCEQAKVKPFYVFVVDRGDDCLEVIERRALGYAINFIDRDKGTDQRTWNPRRYGHMVKIRNELLRLVRGLEAERFLSIDSDILAHPNLVETLLRDLDDGTYAAVGGKCYMTEAGVRFPSWGRIGPTGQLQRYDASGQFPVDVIMAIKLMAPAAYQVDYEFDTQGEDIGWSKACHRAGLRLAWNGRIASKHILAPHMLGRADARVGY